jgi:hypothetical protein
MFSEKPFCSRFTKEQPMSRIAISLLVAVAALCALSARIALAEELKCEGTIAKIEGNNVTVKTADAQHELMIAPTTRVTLDGKAAKATDLKVGFKVRCTADKDGDKVSCRAIEATTASE